MAQENQAAGKLTPLQDSGGPRVLVVDNDPVFQRILSEILEEQGCRVRGAADGLAGLELLEEWVPEVIIVDLIMPRINGERLCRIIRSEPRFDRTALIILSAVATEQQVDFAALGADACIAKGPRDKMAADLATVLSRGHQPLNKGGKPAFLDIREVVQRGVTRELLNLRRHHETILANLTDAVIEVALPSGRVIHLNRAALALLAASEEELLGRELPECFPANCREQLAALLAVPAPAGPAAPAGTLLSFGDRLFECRPAWFSDEDGEECLLVILRDLTDQKRGEQALQQSYAELDQIFNRAPYGILLADLDFNILRINQILKEQFQLDQEAILKKCYDVLPGPCCRTSQCPLIAIREGAERVDLEVEKFRADGGSIPLRVSVLPYLDAEGQLIGIMIHSQDISRRRQAEEALRVSTERLKAIFENSLVGIAFLRNDRTIAELNQRAAELLGYQPQELIGQPARILHLSDEAYQEFGRRYMGKLSHGEVVHVEYQLRRKDGSPLWCVLSGKVVTLPDQGQGVVWVADDISRRKAAEESQRQIIEELRLMQEALRLQSIRDPLTGLYNRRYLEEALRREISRGRRHGTPLAVFMLDLDRFKAINDRYGHVTGDLVLRRLAEIIGQQVREEDVACRYGGEEFVVIFPGLGREDARRRAEELRRQVENHLQVEADGQSLSGVTVSIGVALAAEGMDAEALLRQADAALYQAKRQGRNQVMLAGESADG